MSSSVFKVYASSSRDGFDEGGAAGDLAGSGETDLKEPVHEDLKLDSNLVILLNKDGSVSVDQNTLQSLLANETTGTSVSLVRISSPTPSIEEEIEEERRRLKDEKQREDADGASGASSNEDSNDDSNSVAGTSSGTSSIAAVGGSSRRTRTMSKKGSATGTTVLTEAEEEPRHVSLTVEGFYPPSEAQNFAAQVLSLAGYEHPLRKEVVDIEYIRYTVSNDHCYTTLATTSHKAVEPKGQTVEDLDSSEESSSHSVKTAKAGKIADQQKSSVTARSFNKGSALATVGSSKGANLNRRKSTFGPQISGGSSNAKDQKRKKSKAGDREIDEPLDEDDDDEELEEEEDDEFYSDYEEDEESSFSEEDDELDVDFSVSGRSSSVKKRKQQTKGRNKPSPKAPRRSSITGPPASALSKKAEKEHDASQAKESKESSKFKMVKSVRNTMNESVTKVFTPQTAKQQQQQQQQMLAKVKAAAQSHSQSHPSKRIPTKTYTLTTTSTPGGPMTILSPMTGPPISSSKPMVKVPSKADVTHNQSKPTPPPTPVPSPSPTTVTAVTSVTPQKKDKKPKSAALDAAMVSDISALFSTPDIIKKVNTGKNQQGPSPTTSAVPIVKATTSEPTVVAASAPKVVVIEQPKPTLPSIPVLTESIPTSSPTPTPAPTSAAAPTTNPVLAEQRLDLIHAIVQEDLRQPPIATTPAVTAAAPIIMQQPAEIPNIVKMLETTANMVDAGYDPMAQQWLMAPIGVKPMEEPVGGLLPDNNAILEALNSGVDALPEDLLEHVAELAKNKELQEILDKQVLGVIGPSALDPHSTLSLPQQHPQQQQQQQLVLNQADSAVPTTISEYLPNLTVREQQTPRKEAIQIRRSDGRVITLPPIEAPATRASKRRAQGTPVTPSSQLTAISEDDLSTPKGVRVQQKALGSTVPSLSQPATPGSGAVDESTGTLIVDDSAATAKGTKRGNKTAGPEGNRTKRLATSTTVADSAAAQDDDLDSDESWNSEDDPDRLWCICRQPHNNRFMICCDSCEDWFHGKCVNITKAMGQQMEHDGIEWTCPNCLKKKADRQQPKMTEFLISAGSNLSAQTSTTNTIVIQEPGTPAVSEETTPNACIVCSKPAKPNSIYCSDDCIRKHAGSVPMVKMTDKAKDRRPSVAPSTSVTPTELIPTSPNPSAETIIVMERTTGRCLAGKFGPTAENIKQWLLEHPTYEVVPPGSPQAAIILKKQAAARRVQVASETSAKKSTVGSPTAPSGSGSSQSPKVQTQLKVNDQKKMVIVSSATTGSTSSPKTPGATGKASANAGTPSASKPTLVQKTITGTSRGAATSPITTGSIQRASDGASGQSKASGSPAGGSPATSSAFPSIASKPPKKPTTSSSANSSLSGEHGAPGNKQQTTPTGKSATTTGGENIRVTVKKTLKEHLMQRTAELKEDSTIPRLNEEEIDRFVKETEGELFALFNKDTGMKYRAKYRSLVFNIKDRKNLSLFQKICEKIIEPKQLVRMTADELASQELAQWRENETKHQLEMIKKTELESLACAKNYVVKTHKGEELIEGKGEDRVQLDPSVPVDDVVSLLNNSAVSSTSELDESFVSSGGKDTSSYRTKDYDFGGYGKHYNTALYGSASSATSSLISSSNTLLAGKPEAGGGASSSSSSSTLRKKDSRRSSRSRSRSRGRKRDRDRSRDRSRSKHKRKRSRERSHDRDREKERDRDRDRDKERDRDRHHRGRDRSRDRSKHERKSSREKDATKTGSSSEKRRASVASAAGREPDISDSSSRAKLDQDASKDNTHTSKTVSSAGKKGSADETATSKVGDAASRTSITENAGDPSMVNPDEATKGSPTDVVKESKPEQDQEPTSTVTIPTPPHQPPYEGESPDDAAPNQPSEEAVDETTREAERTYWTGSVHMVDVASVVMSIRAVSGDIQDVAKDFSADLDICGTIKPELVWDYIAQIRKSTNKEICLVRFHSRETSAYYTLYNHLFTRKRYSVVKAPSAAIKDFYIFPLPAEQMVPMILKPLGGVGIIEGDQKPNLLLGVLVKIKGKRPAIPPVSASQVKVARRQSKGSIGTTSAGGNPSSSGTTTGVASSTASLMQQVITKYATKQPPSNSAPPIVDNDAATTSNTSSAVASHKQADLLATTATAAGGTGDEEDTTKKREDEKQEVDMDVDMDIIKAPIVGKGSSATPHLEGNSNSSVGSATGRAGTAEPMVIDEDDDDAPYSPGGASDDSNFADVTAIVETSKQESQSDVERIKREMDELNRKIAMQKNEIVGLMTMNELSEGEINSTLPPSLINDIPIPANLSQILASIKGGAGGGATGDDENPSTSSSSVGFGSMKASSIPLAVAATTTGDDDEEYNPSAPSLFAGYQSSYVPQTVNSLGDIDERILPPTILPAASITAAVATPFELIPPVATQVGVDEPVATGSLTTAGSSATGESRLAKLSDEELLRLVPDDAMIVDSSLNDS